MTNSVAHTRGPVSTAEIANLLAWARSLSDAGASASASAHPVERAAYQAAKTALLARITDHASTSSSPRDAL